MQPLEPSQGGAGGQALLSLSFIDTEAGKAVMHQATTFYSDGLDVIAEFLACSRPAADGIVAVYQDQRQYEHAMRQLARWNRSQGLISGNEVALRISVSAGTWNGLYAAALSMGRAATPDAIGMSTCGAGGMLAELSSVPLMADALQPCASHPHLHSPGPGAGHEDGPWLQLAWQPLQKLLLRDRLLEQEVRRPRLSVEAMPQGCAGLDADTLTHGFVLQAPGQPPQLICAPGWQARIAEEVGRHFKASVLLLFRLMFHDTGQGWGWEADSAQCRGLSMLMAQAEDTGLTDFNGMSETCMLLTDAIDKTASGEALEGGLSAAVLLADAVMKLAAMWPQEMLHPRHPSARLMAGWMAQVDEKAQVAPDALLGPGVRIGRGSVVESGAIIQGGAEVGAGVLIPEGVVVAAGARVTSLMLDEVLLPPGTVLCGSARLQRGVRVGRQVTLGSNVHIGTDVHLPDGIVVADLARVRRIYLGRGVVMAPGTRIEGNLSVGMRSRIGSRVCFGADVDVGAEAEIGSGLYLPRGIMVAAGARISRCNIAASTSIPPGTVLHGDLTLRRNCVVGIGVVFGYGADIGPDVMLPSGVTVMANARIERLQLNGCQLPHQTMIGGNLTLGRQCRVGRHVVFEGDNRISPAVQLPAGIYVSKGARIKYLRLHAPLPLRTVVCGNLITGPTAQIGRGVILGADVTLRATIPDGISVAPGAVVRKCDVAGAVLGWDTRIEGDLYLADGVELGDHTRFEHGVRIKTACRIPDGLVFRAGARVRFFELAPDVTLPPGTRIGGSLRLAQGVQVGAGVEFGDDVEVGPGVHIPDGARIANQARITHLDIAPDADLPACFHLHGNAIVGAAACIGDNAMLGRDVVIGPGVTLPAGTMLCDGARLGDLRLGEGVSLPAGTRIGGNLVVRRGAVLDGDVEFGANVEIGPHVRLPEGLQVAPGTCLRVLSIASDVQVPHGTRIQGDLWMSVGVKIGQQVVFGADIRIGPGVPIPDGAMIGDGARIDRLQIADNVMLGSEVVFTGNAVIDACACIGVGVLLGKDVVIGPRVRLPHGVVVADRARVRRFCIGPRATLPAMFIVEGNLTLGQGVVVGHGARLGPDVWAEPGAVINDYAEIPAGTRVTAAIRTAGIIPVAPSPDASLPVWQAYMAQLSLNRQQGTTQVDAQAPGPQPRQAAVATAQPADADTAPAPEALPRPASAPITIPSVPTAYPSHAPAFRPLSPFG
jgi:UDP-3-O-[3-hydroxymyristoyl] glucosamine N-acyltransferase